MVVNGENYSIDTLSEKTLEELVNRIQPGAKAVAVELNGEIAPREKWKETELKDSDRVELIRFVGGG